MAQAPQYEPTTSFRDNELNNQGGRSTVSTELLDGELQEVAVSINALQVNQELNQRDDGEIRDQRVKLHTLAADVLALLTSYGATPRGPWATATSYAIKDLVSYTDTNTYICVSAHTSGVFATDLAAGRWLLFTLGTAIGAGAITFAPTGTIAATNVQAAINEADTEGRALSASLANAAQAAANVYTDTLRTNLADTSSASNGAGLVGFSDLLSYAAGTVGAIIRTILAKLRGWVSVDDYGAVGDNVTDDLAAFNAALAAVPNGGALYLTPGKTYRLSGPWTFPNTKLRVRVYFRGAIVRADHTGNGIVLTSQNENYGQHVLYEPYIQGPNVSYPMSAAELAGTSTGAAVYMGSGGTNAASAFGNEFHNPRFQGFRYGMYLQAAIWTKVYGGFSRFNQYGIYIDGGQTNGNNWYGHNVRENRERGLFSTGNTSGSLTNATANVFHGGGFETNIPYRGDNPAGYSGGYPSSLDVTGKGVAVFLTNTYDCIFDGVYFENHNYSVWLNGSSDNNSFERCRFDGGGGGRTGGVLLDTSGTSYNTFSRCTKNCTSATEVNVETFNANQDHNQFLDCEGFNFIAANLVSIPFVRNNRKNQAGGGTQFAALGVPKQGVVDDVSVGTTPGSISAVNTATATLYAYGYGEITFGSVIAAAAGNTTITTIDIGTMRNCFLLLRNYQVTRTVTIKHDGATGPIVMKAGADKVLSTYNAQVLFWINSLGHLVEV